MENTCVIIVLENLDLEIIYNVIFTLGNSLGKNVPELVNEDVLDKDYSLHKGLAKLSHSILKCDSDKLSKLNIKLKNNIYNDLFIFDYTDVFHESNNYNEYINKISSIQNNELKYYGILIYGDKKKVNKLIKNFLR